ncbi:peroxiredoxin family protein [Microbacter margulisiae]|uniref:Thiol-disulfide isomerase/thioredoxin n=1 Tax=Microbacter margulisiae TaxID=1350067 RepID=A0A7W5H113_9PORP|nr:TlpA disulfide reductase family protein [Microbacter margulisiae]MBB3187083.1 thiol-disulfide isomerase/thioredoxin [Microbacter margulisiae]
MYKYLIPPIILLFCMMNVFARNTSIIMHGMVNSDSGTVTLIPVGDDIFYPDKNSPSASQVINKRFAFTNNATYPLAFRLGLKKESRLIYISDIFFVCPGVQNVLCNKDSIWEIPKINNSCMTEYTTSFKNASHEVEAGYNKVNEEHSRLSAEFKSKIPQDMIFHIQKEYNVLIHKKDSVLFQYTKIHPNSYVALWELVDRFTIDGYKSIYDSIYVHLSSKIKNTYTGEILAQKLHAASVTCIGSIFPKLLISDSKKQVLFNPKAAHKKYTLIDFWFSHCGACIGQFNDLKNIYALYDNKGFMIVGISIDDKDNINNWRAIIDKYHLPWKQYLDFNGRECHKLSIEVFPSNFLLNEQGKIIAKSISPNELSKFLKTHLP